jgi:hypothetical protein
MTGHILSVSEAILGFIYPKSIDKSKYSFTSTIKINP